MRVTVRVSLLSVLLVSSASAFSVPHQQQQRSQQQRVRSSSLYSTAESASSSTLEDPSLKKTASLGLLTFDLDDTLYPLAPVIEEANAAFARAMANYGFPDILPSDITTASIKLRKEIEKKDPNRAITLTHTEIRKLAIREAMEQVMWERKLQECAQDWATNVESLGPAVVASARRWSNKAVSTSVVEAVLTAWEMERHHAAERHLYTEVVPALKAIKKEHPGVIIGAITDGKADPMFMTFTLRNFFDFCINWEDDQGARRNFFLELSKVSGKAELSWIYNAARERGKELAEANAAIQDAADKKASSDVPNFDDSVWIHVGDDLAYDVGGAAQCGAKTILMELADKYGQTARHRFEDDSNVIDETKLPDWSVSSTDELQKRSVMNEAAMEFVDERLEFMHLLPETITKILSNTSSSS